MHPIIFLGPSLNIEKARSIFPLAEYRPPARKGDLLRIATRGENAFIGLIDGVFMQDYPPTPIEVYTALKKGVVIAGAASIGALRAVELDKFGMIGIGKIYELYKEGKIEADDEVAVTFSDDYRLQSEALIDIRYTLYHAFKNNIIDNEVRKKLVRIAKDIYFPYRTYEEIIERAKGSIDDSILERVKAYVRENRVSLKEKDSIKLLNFMKKRCLES